MSVRAGVSEPWTELASATVPGESEGLRLLQRGDAFSIMVGQAELMIDGVRGSEAALATLACTRIRDRPGARVLIGGLGMGYTLRAALDALGPDAQVVVAELVPDIVAWARGPLAHLFAGSLDDPRVEIFAGDVARAIQAGPARYDAILLDVDNGPHALTHRANRRLYDVWGVKRARYALRPDGILAVWSGAPSRQFKARLRRTGFTVEEVRLRANPETRRHVLWLATRTAEGPW